MSFEANRLDRESGERLAQTLTSIKRGLWAVLMALTALIALVVASMVLGGDTPKDDRVAVVFLPEGTVATPDAVPTPGWVRETACFSAEFTFDFRSDEHCLAPFADCRGGFLNDDSPKESLADFLRKWETSDSFGIIAVYGGHDSIPIAKDNTKHDSNFDLAHRRAIKVAAQIAELSKGRPFPWAIMPIAGSYPPNCGTTTPTPIDKNKRRQPVLRVTTWRRP